MGIRDYKFFAAPMLTVLLVVAGCSFSESQVIDESKYEDLHDDDETSLNDDTDPRDEDELDDGSEGLDEEDFPDPPQLPDAAKDPSDDGAIAAVEYFFESYTYAFQTSNTEAFEKVVAKKCKLCSSIVEAFEQRNQENSYAVTDGYSSPECVDIFEEDGYKIIHVTVDFDEEILIDQEGDEELIMEATTYSVLIALTYKDEKWFVRKVDAVDLNE